MEPITSAIIVVLVKYALDKGVELAKTVGPHALDVAKEMFETVITRVEPEVAKNFPENPELYKLDVENKINEQLAIDPVFNSKLNKLFELYKNGAQTYQEEINKTNSDRISNSKVSKNNVNASGGGIAIGGNVFGDIEVNNNSHEDDK